MERSTVDTDFLTTTTLPDQSYNHFFDDIIIPSQIKEVLVNHGITVQLLNKAGVKPRKITCTGLALLYGPQGTGKTSLARGVPNKLAHQLDQEILFRHVDVNQLFSSELGDSPRAVSEVFDEIISDADRDLFQCILFDEIESLLVSRKQLSTDTDPSDVTRAVNTTLQRLDQLIDYPNVIVYATSNQPDVIDAAFFDRADLRVEIGNPSNEARVAILANVFDHLNTHLGTDLPTNLTVLQELAEETNGASARDLRNIALGATIFTDGKPSELTYNDIREYVARGSLRSDGFTLSTSDDSFTVDATDQVDSGSDTLLTFVFDHRSEANSIRDEVPDEHQTGRYDRRYKRIELDGDTPARWVQHVTEAADDVVETTTHTQSSDTDSLDIGGNSHHDGHLQEQLTSTPRPRVAVYDQQEADPAASLLERIGKVAATTLDRAEHRSATILDDLLRLDRVEEFVFPLVQLAALRAVEFNVREFTFKVKVGYDDQREFLEAPPKQSLPTLDGDSDGNQLSVTFITNEDGHKQVTDFTPFTVRNRLVRVSAITESPKEVEP